MTEPRTRYRIPLHPILVTVPIGTWTASLIFDLTSRVHPDPGFLTRGSWWLIGIGLIGAVIAGAAGFFDALPVPSASKAFKVALTHMLLATAVVLLYAASYVVRAGSPFDQPVSGWLIALSVVGIVTVVATVIAGGTLAHRYGVRGADEATRAAGFQQTTSRDPDRSDNVT